MHKDTHDKLLMIHIDCMHGGHIIKEIRRFTESEQFIKDYRDASVVVENILARESKNEATNSCHHARESHHHSL